MVTFPNHLFVAAWQYHMFSSMKKNVKEGEVVSVYDFAENYRTSYQDEVQSAHWNYNQVTVHPVVNYYSCHGCTELVTHSVVVISDDLKHDAFAVDSFIRKVHSFFYEKNLKFKRSIEWSDGCAAQYKSKLPFYLLQRRGSNGLPVSRHYFGSRHGKNPSDGESAVVKSAVCRAVQCRRAVVRGAEDFFKFVSANLKKGGEMCSHFKRDFIYVRASDIPRPRMNVKPLPGTRSIQSLEAQDGCIKHRNLSSLDASTDSDYVDAWKQHKSPYR